jgi:tetratricopeptide (TPR) repeat protein
MLNIRKQPVRATLVAVPVAIIGGLLLSYLVFSGKSRVKATLEKAIEKLEAGDIVQARHFAAEVRARSGEPFANVGGAFYVLGAVMIEDAKNHDNAEERKTLYLIASRYLEESRIRGFPPGKENDGLLLLARSLHHGGRYSASILILKEGLPKNPAAKGELLYLLADSYLHLSPPKVPEAAAQVRRLLAEKHLSAAERERGLLLQGRIALSQRQFAEGRAALDRIPAKSPLRTEAVLLSVRLLCDELSAAKGKRGAPEIAQLNSSLKAIEAISTKTRQSADVQARVQLLTGRILHLLHKPQEASAVFAQLRKAHFGSPEAVVAAFDEAEYLLAIDPEEAVALFQKGLAEAGPAESYQNDWLPREELEVHMQAALTRLLVGNHFGPADKLAASLPPLLPEEMAYRWRARAEHEWGVFLRTAPVEPHTTAAFSDVAPPSPTTPTTSPLPSREHQAREHFRKAAAHYERLAELRIATTSYLDDLMDSARDYLAGQAYSRASEVLRKFLNEDPASGQEEARVSLGEALLAIGQSDEGLKVLEQAITAAPRHPATYRARYLAAIGYEELGKIAEARRQLNDNLYNFSLTPESIDWRDSIFLLGRLVYHEALAREAKSRELGVDQQKMEFKKPGLKELEVAEGLFQEAARTLDEAVERYPSAPQATQARYFLAEAHRQAARWPRKRLDTTAIEATRGALTRDMQAELTAALAHYTFLIEKLSAEGDGSSGGEVERGILRNSYFARADVLFDQGKFDEARDAYSAATSRYQHEPVALEAYVQIAACYRRLGRSAEARGTLEQARVVLTRMKPETDFIKSTPYNREEWTLLLTWLSEL